MPYSGCWQTLAALWPLCMHVPCLCHLQPLRHRHGTSPENGRSCRMCCTTHARHCQCSELTCHCCGRALLAHPAPSLAASCCVSRSQSDGGMRRVLPHFGSLIAPLCTLEPWITRQNACKRLFCIPNVPKYLRKMLRFACHKARFSHVSVLPRSIFPPATDGMYVLRTPKDLEIVHSCRC